MKKLEVNHTPDFITAIVIVLALTWIISIFVFCSVFEYAITLILSMALLVFIVMIGFIIDEQKTIVEYDIDKVKWKWFRLEYTADFNNLDSVHYTIIHERTRYGYNRRFEIVFQLTDSTELRLNDRLESNDIDDCINGITDNIRLMQLYRFIENVYPEKCTGFIKNDT
ncbi:MAG: hypothetical protein K2G36_04245 [Ruminococcus sp.]|nr:hypothetical protein [Ruminococcus sp.]